MLVHSARGAVILFDVSQPQSDVDVSVSLSTPLGGDSDSASSSLTGTVIGVADSMTAPFSEFRIVGLDVATGDATSLSFCLVEFIGCLAGVDVTAGAGDLSVIMVNPGPTAPVIAGNFTQVSNDLKLTGDINIDATGLADGQFPEGPFILDSDPIANDLPGAISESGGVYDLTVDLSAQGIVDDPDTGVTTDFTIRNDRCNRLAGRAGGLELLGGGGCGRRTAAGRSTARAGRVQRLRRRACRRR